MATRKKRKTAHSRAVPGIRQLTEAPTPRDDGVAGPVETIEEAQRRIWQEHASAYAAAIEQEREYREYAFLGVAREIRGVPVNVMTLRMFTQLCHVKSPFLVGGQISAAHVAQFLWR